MMERSSNRSSPIVAILTVEDDTKQFRGNRPNFIDIITTGAELGIPVFVVTTKDLNLRMRSIRGYEYNGKTKEWKQRVIPLPDIIYNRIPYREDEHLPENRRLIAECLRHPRVRLYNPSFFNKWHLFEWLSSSNATKNHIPETCKYSEKLKLLPLLRKHPFLYMKPEKGKAGKGIMRIRRVAKPKVVYVLKIQEQRNSATLRFPTVAKLKQYLQTAIGQEDYIVQQGVALSTVDRRPFDLRVLVQKNGKGKWALTGVGARIAGETSITTHVPRGGSIDSPQKLLSASFGKAKAARLLKRTGHTSLSIAKRIEKQSGHLLGEMSLDLGVDQKGRIWFFEANSKPMKFDEPHIREKSLQRFFEYCRYLARKRTSSVRSQLRGMGR